MLAALLLAAAAPQTPQAFVSQLYARYRDERFSPFHHIDGIFAPPLARAIRLDQKLAGPGEIGALDGDPICDCQDSDGYRPMSAGPFGPTIKPSSRSYFTFPASRMPYDTA